MLIIENYLRNRVWQAGKKTGNPSERIAGEPKNLI